MSRAFVVDASPLILLSRIHHLHLLPALAEVVVFPETVLSEMAAGSGHDDAASRVMSAPNLRRVPDLEVPENIRQWNLGAGESQVLAFALANTEFEAVIDDQGARRCARSLRIPYTGTLGIVLSCRHRGVIPAARPIIRALEDEGIRLAPALIEAALAEVGE